MDIFCNTKRCLELHARQQNIFEVVTKTDVWVNEFEIINCIENERPIWFLHKRVSIMMGLWTNHWQNLKLTETKIQNTKFILLNLHQDEISLFIIVSQLTLINKLFIKYLITDLSRQLIHLCVMLCNFIDQQLFPICNLINATKDSFL